MVTSIQLPCEHWGRELLIQEIKRLQKYESMVHYIANDYIELSYDKAQWQRDDWRKRCRKTIAEAHPEEKDD